MMFSNNDFDPTEPDDQSCRVQLVRLAEIQEDLKTLAQARDRIIRELTNLRATLEAHRQAGHIIHTQAIDLLHRLITQAEEGMGVERPLTFKEAALIQNLEASRLQLTQDVEMTEQRLRVAQFEANSWTQMLEELRNRVAEMAADLDFSEDAPHERH
jgi:uncharacterized coiled-coil DUF342 family protein